jgi:hypothetical protein
VGILHNWFSEQGARMKSMLSELPPEPARPGPYPAGGEVPPAPY